MGLKKCIQEEKDPKACEAAGCALTLIAAAGLVSAPEGRKGLCTLDLLVLEQTRLSLARGIRAVLLLVCLCVCVWILNNS